MSEELLFMLVPTAATLLLGVGVQLFTLRFAHRFKLYDYPTVRRKHKEPIPVVGGVGVFITWGLGLAFIAYLDPDFIRDYGRTILVLSISILLLIGVGIWDDVRGLGPNPKLVFQTLAAVNVVLFEPNVNQLITHWSHTLGFLSWVLGVLWIVGITNSINLIDGLDGLAGGMSVIVAISLFILSAWVGSYARFAMIGMGLLVASILPFLYFNWHPAKVYLGDNGSLPVGMLLASASLMGKAQTSTWIMIPSLILMLGYPILDTTLSVIRRRKKGLHPFKADRSHLHFRIMRLGLSVPQTAVLLLSIGVYLQLSALAINRMSIPSAALGIGVIAFSLFSLLFLVKALESWHVNRVFPKGYRPEHQSHFIESSQAKFIMTIDLEPLLEGMSQMEPKHGRKIMDSLELMLKSSVREEDLLFMTEKRIFIWLHDLDPDPETLDRVKSRFNDRIMEFIKLYNLEVTTSRLPIAFEQKKVSSLGVS